MNIKKTAKRDKKNINKNNERTWNGERAEENTQRRNTKKGKWNKKTQKKERGEEEEHGSLNWTKQKLKW